MNNAFAVIIMVLLTVVAISWTGITIYDSVAKVDVSPNVETQIRPISSTFDSDVLVEIDARTDKLPVSPNELIKIEAETVKRIENLKGTDEESNPANNN